MLTKVWETELKPRAYLRPNPRSGEVIRSVVESSKIQMNYWKNRKVQIMLSLHCVLKQRKRNKNFRH